MKENGGKPEFRVLHKRDLLLRLFFAFCIGVLVGMVVMTLALISGAR